jgi:ABC-type multidrug transport system permease subunit
LRAAGADAAMSGVLLNIYDASRTQAFKAGIVLLIYFALLGLILSLWLPRRKLVEEKRGR